MFTEGLPHTLQSVELCPSKLVLVCVWCQHCRMMIDTALPCFLRSAQVLGHKTVTHDTLVTDKGAALCRLTKVVLLNVQLLMQSEEHAKSW